MCKLAQLCLLHRQTYDVADRFTLIDYWKHCEYLVFFLFSSWNHILYCGGNKNVKTRQD